MRSCMLISRRTFLNVILLPNTCCLLRAAVLGFIDRAGLSAKGLYSVHDITCGRELRRFYVLAFISMYVYVLCMIYALIHF